MATILQTSTLSNQSLATALLVATYTADAAREIYARVAVDQVAGNGDYVVYATIQLAGAGSAYRLQPSTTATVASGVTAIAFHTIPILVNTADVVKIYVTGLAGDTTTPDITTQIFEASVAQTGDSFVRIGAAGAGLSAVPWNAAWDAEVQSEAADALTAYAPATVGAAMTLATGAVSAAALATDAAQEIADTVLRRTAANIEASANGDTLSVESLYGVIMASFEAALSGTTLTVRKSDGSTLGTKTVTVDAAADPITGIT